MSGAIVCIDSDQRLPCHSQSSVLVGHLHRTTIFHPTAIKKTRTLPKRSPKRLSPTSTRLPRLLWRSHFDHCHRFGLSFGRNQRLSRTQLLGCKTSRSPHFFRLPSVSDYLVGRTGSGSKLAKRPKMEINRLVTAELGMQVRVILTTENIFASLLPILGHRAGNTTTYAPCRSNNARRRKNSPFFCHPNPFVIKELGKSINSAWTFFCPKLR